MAVTLVFHGGLFSVLPCSGPLRRVDVHLRLAGRVEARSRHGRRLSELETILSSAVRIDFQSRDGRVGIRPARIPVRPVSDVIPIDYQGFRKTVSFSGGTLSGAGGKLATVRLSRLRTIKKRGDAAEMLRAFEALTGTRDDEHTPGALTPLVANFFASLRVEVVRRWLPGYRIEVRVAGRRVGAALNGRSPAHPIPSGSRIEFRVDPRSTIPHYPSGNPHVLEHPPMAGFFSHGVGGSSPRSTAHSRLKWWRTHGLLRFGRWYGTCLSTSPDQSHG